MILSRLHADGYRGTWSRVVSYPLDCRRGGCRETLQATASCQPEWLAGLGEFVLDLKPTSLKPSYVEMLGAQQLSGPFPFLISALQGNGTTDLIACT